MSAIARAEGTWMESGAVAVIEPELEGQLAAPAPPLRGTAGLDDVAPAGGAAGLEGIERALAERIGEQRYGLWFEGKAELELDDGRLRVRAANAFAAKWIREKFAADLRAAAAEAGYEAVELLIEVAEAGPRPVAAPAPAAPTPTRTHHATPLPTATLNPRYTLEEFVVGACNRMAYQAAVRVAEAPGQQFNPLFIHGTCGLGKTHLLQGICRRFAASHPGKRWLYLTGEQFTNEFLEALKGHKMDAFRRRLRSAELLVIDDIHFLANKKATQEEFLHTFNQIDAAGRQVVLASDCPPKAIATMAEALTSRFVSGMVVRVDAPDVATRLEILRRKAVRGHCLVSDAVLMHVAQQAVASVRELEGLLLQVAAGASLLGEEGAEDAADCIRQRMAGGPAPIAVERIVAATAEHFGVMAGAILGGGREKTLSLARAVAMYLARQHTGMSFPELGRAMGGKNHSTVIAACRRVEELVRGGELLCWTTANEARRQTAGDVVRELESAVRRRV